MSKCNFTKVCKATLLKSHFGMGHGVNVDPGPRDPGTQDRESLSNFKTGTRDPLKFKSGTPEPPSKFKSMTPEPLQSLKVGRSY